MTPGTYVKTPGRTHRFPPALLTDLPVLVVLVLSWVTVPVFWAHLATGLMLIAIVAIHLCTRRRLPLHGVPVWRRLAYGAFLVAATAVAETGLLRWAGVPPQYVWHGGISYLLLGLVAVHLWSVRRALRARLRPRSGEKADPTAQEGIMSKERFDTVVIGAGQAGLAIGYHLARQRSRFVIVDAGNWVGQSWDARWDSLRLFTPAHFTHLPGLRFPAQRRYRPSKGEMADYLRSYAARFALPVRLGWRVDQLSRDRDGYRICSAGRSLRADTVVVATGPAMRPRVPNVADKLDPAIRSLHSVDYRNPEQLRDGAVLIVGAGNSGAEIALDVAPTHQVILAGRDVGRLPISLGGAVYWLMNQLLTANTSFGRKVAASVHAGKGTPLVRVRPGDLAEAGVERAPRVVGQVDGRPQLEDGRVLDVANVIWCTGYRPDYSWIALPQFPRDEQPAHQRGAVLDQPGLYVVGLPFLFRMASSLVGGVGADARHIAHLIARELQMSRSPTTASGDAAGHSCQIN